MIGNVIDNNIDGETMENVLEYLEKTANRYPDKAAVIDEQGAYTFARLQEVAECIGKGLMSYDIGNKPVFIVMDKSKEALGVMLGVAYAGGFYVSIDPKTPKERITRLVELVEPVLVISEENWRQFMSKGTCEEGNLREKPGLDTLLYGCFTSGSTGIPKLVTISHGAVIAFIESFTCALGIGNEDVLANQAQFDFDVSVKDIYSALSVGATLVLVPRKMFSMPGMLMDYLEKHSVTTLIWVVSALGIVKQLDGLSYKAPGTIDKIIFSGEIMPSKVLEYWQQYYRNVTFTNVYGPTEITCNCTYYSFKGKERMGIVPIGRAFDCCQVFLINEDGVISSSDTESVGEICVSGPTLSKGYYGDSISGEKVFRGSFIDSDTKMYCTGDMAKYDEKGELIYIGRIDNQIKRNGYRVELEEIENTFIDIDGVYRACCVYEKDTGKLILYYTGETQEGEARKWLRKYLPSYMLPDKLIKLERLPQTNSGKVDRKALKEAGGWKIG